MRGRGPSAGTPPFAILRHEAATPAQGQQRRDERPGQAPGKPQAPQRQAKQKPAGRPGGTRSFGGRGSGRPGGFRAGRV